MITSAATPRNAKTLLIQRNLSRRGSPRPPASHRRRRIPPKTKHAFVGAGAGPLVLLCASSRQFQKDGPWGYYCVDEVAAKYNASSPEDTQDSGIAYARFSPSRATRYPDDLLGG
jgi:hypothetical protein